MKTASIDIGIEDNQLPGSYCAGCAAISMKQSPGESSIFDGLFVDFVGGKTINEQWTIRNSATITAEELARLIRFDNDPRIAEVGAITCIATLLAARSELVLSNVQQIGTHSDYSLASRYGQSAGVIECKGLSGQYTSNVASSARENVRLSKHTPQRIGVVAFGGREIRIEVVG